MIYTARGVNKSRRKDEAEMKENKFTILVVVAASA
jgi:hypothetical protein